MNTFQHYARVGYLALMGLFIAAPLVSFAQSNPVTSPSGPSEYFNRNSTNRFNKFGEQLGYGAPKEPEVIIVNIVRIILGFTGLLLVLLILYGGFLWMTSAGNESKIEKAKKIITNSVIGLVIILTAYAIARWITTALEKAV